MNELKIELPSNISKMSSNYWDCKLSIGQAAKLAGYPSTFIELLSKMGIPVINYPDEDLERRLAFECFWWSGDFTCYQQYLLDWIRALNVGHPAQVFSTVTTNCCLYWSRLKCKLADDQTSAKSRPGCYPKTQVDEGEAEAILAMELDVFLILDDRKARQLALQPNRHRYCRNAAVPKAKVLSPKLSHYWLP